MQIGSIGFAFSTRSRLLVSLDVMDFQRTEMFAALCAAAATDPLSSLAGVAATTAAFNHRIPLPQLGLHREHEPDTANRSN